MGMKPDPLDPGRFDNLTVRQKVQDKFQQIVRELGHIQFAARNLDGVLRTGKTSASTDGGQRKMELREWVVSLVESVAYVEWQIGTLPAVTKFGEELGASLGKGETKAFTDGPKK